MPHETTTIQTADGACPAHILTPDGPVPWPAVIFYMDGLGIRPALIDMAARLAAGGYLVLLPDLYYRAGPYEPLDAKTLFAAPDIRAVLAPLLSATDNRRAAQDTAAFIAYLDTRTDILGRKFGTTGYCMGGGISLTAAGTFPDRIAAAASFHGGNLATDSDLSPHLLAPHIKARVYVAGADNDSSYPPEMATSLEQALSAAAVPHVCEIYQGALHGWTMTDFPIYNEPAAERHWQELFKLYEETLPKKANLGRVIGSSEYHDIGGWKAFATGDWLAKLIGRAFANYWNKSDADFFKRKYPNLTKDQIAAKMISLACKNSVGLGLVTGVAISTNEIIGLLTAGEGGIGLPANIAVAAASIGAEMIGLTHIQLKMLADLGNLYEVPLDVDDPEEIWTIIAFAIGGSTAETAGKIVKTIGENVTKKTVQGVFSKETLKLTQKLTRQLLGKTILQRTLIKYSVPVVSVAIGGTWNYVSTRTMGRIATRHFKKVIEEKKH